jgi:hypothetical protein
MTIRSVSPHGYFSDVESIPFSTGARQRVGSARERLEAALEAYALTSDEYRQQPVGDLATRRYRGQGNAWARQRLRWTIRDLLAEAVETGDLRDDVAPDELAIYCMHSLRAASNLSSRAAIRRLITIILAGLRPQHRVHENT